MKSQTSVLLDRDTHTSVTCDENNSSPGICDRFVLLSSSTVDTLAISGAVLQQGPAELHPGEKLFLIYRVRVEFICVPHESQPHFLKVWSICRGKSFTSYGTLVQVSKQNTLTYAQIETRKCDPVRIEFRRTEFNEGNPIQAGTPSSFAVSLKNVGKDDVHGVQFDGFYPTIGMGPYYNPNSFVCQNKNRIRFKVKVTCVLGEGRYCPPDGLPITFDRPADDAGSYMGVLHHLHSRRERDFTKVRSNYYS